MCCAIQVVLCEAIQVGYCAAEVKDCVALYRWFCVRLFR